MTLPIFTQIEVVDDEGTSLGTVRCPITPDGRLDYAQAVGDRRAQDELTRLNAHARTPEEIARQQSQAGAVDVSHLASPTSPPQA